VGKTAWLAKMLDYGNPDQFSAQSSQGTQSKRPSHQSHCSERLKNLGMRRPARPTSNRSTPLRPHKQHCSIRWAFRGKGRHRHRRQQRRQALQRRWSIENGHGNRKSAKDRPPRTI